MATLATSNLHIGLYFTACIDIYGNVWSFGDNENSKAGHPKEETIICPPKQIKQLENIINISCGFKHISCIDYDGNLYTLGQNEYNQLGIQGIISTFEPQKVPNIPTITSVQCGCYFTAFLDINGNIWSFGQHFTKLPSKQEGVSDIRLFSCEGHNLICVAENEFCYSLGQQLNRNERSNSPTSPCAFWPTDIISIKSGIHHSLILTGNGDVFGCGSNTYGQLGIENNNKHCVIPEKLNFENIKQIECGYQHSMFIDEKDNLWIFGYNFNGQIGTGKGDTAVPIKNAVSEYGVKALSHGGHSTLVKDNLNQIWGFGKNSKCELGVKTNNAKEMLPIKIFKEDEELWLTRSKSRQKSARK